MRKPFFSNRAVNPRPLGRGAVTHLALLFSITVAWAIQAAPLLPEKPSAAADIDSVDWVKSRKETVKTVEDDLSWVKHLKAPDDALAIKDQLLNNVSDIANSALNRNSEAARALGVELDNTSSSPGGNPANSLGHTPIPQRPIIVFISMNLSDDYLREMFAYGATHPDVRFVLQGWIPPKIGDLQNALGALITDLSHPPNIDIDPSIFKQYDVQSVPVFVREDTNPVRRIDGELSLDGAVDWLLSHRPAPANPVGPLSDIEEPNILDEIQQRLENFDWKAQIAKAKENAGHMLQGVFLPPAEKDNTYWVDISTIFKQDITLPDGRVVVKAGTRVNPLDSVRLDHRYVFFDPKDRHQVNIVKKWLRRYNNLTLIATQFKPLADESSALVKELGQLVYPSNSSLIQRFQIHSVPALVEQDNGLLKVTVKKPQHDDSADPAEQADLQTSAHVLPKKAG